MTAAILPSDHRAVFERLRREDGAGEHWWARELQVPSGYRRWEDFERSVKRAQAACANVGEEPDQHIRDAPKINDHGYKVQDYRLTRYGAYLLAMNGDPRKPEIAAAQTYFAVQTRIAETQVPAQRTLPTTFAESLRELAAEVEAREEAEAARQLAEAKVAELEPAADAWTVFASDGQDYEVGDVAKALQRDHGVRTGPQRLFRALVRMGWVYRAPDGRPRPYQRSIETGRLTERLKSYEDRQTGDIVPYWQVRVTAKGMADLLKRRDELEAPPPDRQ